MFNKLKIRLMLMNLILLSVIMGVVFTGIYLYLKRGLGLQSIHLMKLFLCMGGLSLALIAWVSFFLANRALSLVEAAWQKQKNFIADISHELKTPLAVIGTNLELVRGNPEETVASQSKWLENIAYECRIIAKLINDLLFLARADLHGETLQMEEFSLSRILNRAIVPFEPVCAGHGITLRVKIQPEVTIRGYESRIQQLVAILMDNAIKHTSEKGQISLELTATDDAAEITVADTGEGIPQKHLKHIFERFYRADPSQRRKHGGTGLGLAIADGIVKEHSGTIKVSSIVGKGSAFKIILPKKPKHAGG